MRIVYEGKAVPITYKVAGRRLYLDKVSKDFQNNISWCFLEQNRGERPYKTEIWIRIIVYVYGKREDISRKKKRIPKIPDLSNVVKSIENALEGLAYLNDNQISIIHAQRIMVKDKKEERIEVEIEPLK